MAQCDRGIEMSVRKGNDVIAGGTVITIDSQIDINSINPVQNSAIAREIQGIDDVLETIAREIQGIDVVLETKQDNIVAGSGITITETTVAVGNLDCGIM